MIRKRWCWLIAICVIAIYVCMFVSVVRDFNRDVALTRKISTFGNTSLYYDRATDEYFMVQENIWNIVDPYERIEIDESYAQSLVDATNNAKTNLVRFGNLQIIGVSE